MKQLILDKSTLSETGFTLLPPFLSSDECHDLAALFDAPDLYRKHIVMQQHGYGSGEYKYFSYPLPPVVDALRHELFTQIAPVAMRHGVSEVRSGTRVNLGLIFHDAGPR